MPLLAALTVAACGAASHDSQHTPTQTVHRALTAVSERSFDVTFREVARLRVAGVPRAQASGLEAELRSAGISETGVVHFISLRQFGARLSSSHTGTIYAKATGGGFWSLATASTTVRPPRSSGESSPGSRRAGSRS